MAPKLSRSNTALLIGLVALAVVLLIGVLLMRGGDDGDNGAFRLDLGVPTEASVAELQGFATPSRPVYWIGPPESGRLEVTLTTGAIRVRYLPEGVEPEDREKRSTTVFTYRSPRAYATMARFVRSGRFKSARVEGGGRAGWQSRPGTNVYVAYRRVDYLVEVFDPSPRRARSLATSGRVVRVP